MYNPIYNKLITNNGRNCRSQFVLNSGSQINIGIIGSQSTLLANPLTVCWTIHISRSKTRDSTVKMTTKLSQILQLVSSQNPFKWLSGGTCCSLWLLWKAQCPYRRWWNPNDIRSSLDEISIIVRSTWLISLSHPLVTNYQFLDYLPICQFPWPVSIISRSELLCCQRPPHESHQSIVT